MITQTRTRTKLLAVATLAFCGADRTWGQDETVPKVLSVASTPLWDQVPPEIGKGNRFSGTLYRELLRQALLIAGRDELGLVTRDQTLREPLQQGDSSTLDVAVAGFSREFVSMGIFSVSDDPGNFLWTQKIPMPPDNRFEIVSLVSMAEKWSREDYVALLRKQGMDGTPRKPSGDAPLPKGVSNALSRMTFIDQFGAIRQIHNAIQRDGESPELLGGLARGYANLYQLTLHVWNQSPKAFAARSLLYAERLVQNQKASAKSLWYRAYARALIGLHADALKDIEATSKAGNGIQSDLVAPTWSQILEPFCRFQRGPLVKAGEEKGGNGELALLLAFIVVEESGSDALRIERLRALLDRQPNCFRAHDAVSDLAAINLSHRVTEDSPVRLLTHLVKSLPKVKNIPASVKKKLNTRSMAPASRERANPAGKPDQEIELDSSYDSRSEFVPAHLVARELIKASSQKKHQTDVFSWAILGRLIEETAFVHVQRRARFLRFMLGVEVEDFLEESLESVEGHPFEPLIRSYGLEPTRDLDAYAELLSRVPAGEVDYRMYGFIEACRPIRGARFSHRDQEVFNKAFAISDDIARDMEYAIRVAGGDLEKMAAHALRQTSPHNPAAYAALIRHEWAEFQGEVEKWEAQFIDQPVVQLELARQFRATGKRDDAIRCLENYLTAAADYRAFHELAAIHLEAKDKANWRKTLEAYLEHEDHAMNHATIHMDLAYDYIADGNPPKAIPHGKAAGDTYSYSGLTCLVHCYEAAEKWSAAEKVLKKIGQRYPESRTDWYFWCVRTGKGQIDEARRDLEAEIQSTPAEERSATDAEASGVFYLAEGKPDQAVILFREAHRKSRNPYDALHLAVLVLESGDQGAFRTALEAAANVKHANARMQRPHLHKLAAIFLRAGDQKPDIQEIEGILREAAADLKSKSELPNILYFTGRLLELRGHEDLGGKYLARAANWRGETKWAQILAAQLLKKRGVETEVFVPGSGGS